MVNIDTLYINTEYTVIFECYREYMNTTIAFFLKNTHLNHLLLLFVLLSGIYSYINIPKELFPDVAVKKIMVTGAYNGVSAVSLDKMAVRQIEDSVGLVNGVKSIDSVVRSGTFVIGLSLEDDSEAVGVLERVKDALVNVRQYLPADMHEPIASLSDDNPLFIKLAISSEKIGFEALLVEAKKIRSDILKIPHISAVEIFGESDKKIQIEIDAEALKAYALDPSDVIRTIKELSYTFPIGDIDDEHNAIFISTVNGKKDADAWEETRLRIGEKHLYLHDIATVNIHHPEDSILSSFNGKRTLTLKVLKDKRADAFKLSQLLQEKTKAYASQYQDIDLELFHDTSVPVKERLDVIISNLTLGLILIFFTMYLLINRQTAIIVTVGVPFSFIIGLIFIYHMGYSLNLISLIGAILVVGIAVDDAVVVSENIQRHIDEGMAPYDAAMTGTKEMIVPVTLATLTTVAAFIPMFMLSGETMRFMQLIPVVVILVLFGSLLESFLFLPLHAKNSLKRGATSRDWSRMSDHYERLLHKMLTYKKRTLLFFFIVLPMMTFGLYQVQHFQFFPKHDTDTILITGKLNVNTSLASSYLIAQEITADILRHKEELAIKNVWQINGFRKDLAGDWVDGSNMFYHTITLEEMVDTNFVNRYINPILDLSFDFDDQDKTRRLFSYEIENKLRETVQKYKGKYHFDELGVMSQNIGIISTDIDIDLHGNTVDKIESAVKALSSSLESIDDVTEVVDGLNYGKSEYKIGINSYGERLGLSEGYVASTLSSYFLGNRKAMSFDDEGTIEITTLFSDKDDLNRLTDFELALDDGRFVKLDEVVDIFQSRDHEVMFKSDGNIVKTVRANIDKANTTASKVMSGLASTIKEIEVQGVTVEIHGEQEQSERLRDDMINAVGTALFLMMILLLVIFPKIKYALMLLSVIPLSIFGALLGHLIMDMNITMPSVIGMLGLAGVVINDGILMLDFLHGTHDTKAFYKRAKQRMRPIIITSVTTFIGLSTLIFFATGQAKVMQPLAIALGFGLLWGTVINLLYLPTLYAMVNKIEPDGQKNKGPFNTIDLSE